MYKSVDTRLANQVIAPGENLKSIFQVLPLVQQLCQLLSAENINYCHWKSNNALDQSASGDNDLDLLVGRGDIPKFTKILCQLGFKQAEAPTNKKMPGVLDYFGYDRAADKLVHVHAHYQLIIGQDLTKNYRLPIERPYLESAIQGDLFKVPAPEFEFIIFVLRMMLKHSTWASVLIHEAKLKTTERKELAHFQDQIKQDYVYDLLRKHLPYIDIELFKRCVQALQPGFPTLPRVKIGQRLQAQLRSNAQRILVTDASLKLWRKVSLTIRSRFFKSVPKYRLASGGVMIAIIGGDGAGKSTTIEALYKWLSKSFEITKFHMGKPAWSWTTRLVRGTLKIGSWLGLYPAAASFHKTLKQKSIVSPAYPWLLREVCTAHDRYWTYVRARRFSAKGKLIILDRFPLPEIRLMDGPLIAEFFNQLTSRMQTGKNAKFCRESWLARSMLKLEERYYHQIVPADLLIVLKVDPEIAVQRKTEEDETAVRERSAEIWQLTWERPGTYIVDASKPKSDVLAELKVLIWSEL